MSAPIKNYLRGMRHQLGSLVGLIVIIAVATAFYTTLKTVVANYDTSTETYFNEYKFPDAVVSGVGFSESDAIAVRDVTGVAAVQLRAVVDVKSGDNTLRVFSYDSQNPEVNAPYIYEGAAPSSVDECLITQKYAENNTIKVGMKIALANKTFSDECTVSGLATSPEHMYLRQNNTQPVATTRAFGMVYVDTAFAVRNKLAFNELAVRYVSSADISSTTQEVKAALPAQKLLGVTEHDDIFSYQAHSSDVELFNIFAFIFPVTFFVIASVVVFVSQRRAVMRDRWQIGTMKAMGLGGQQIMWLYVAGAIIVSILGLAVGFGISLAIGPWIIGRFNVMLATPYFNFDDAYKHLLVPVIVSLIICIIPTLLAVWQVVRLKPAAAMRPAPPVAGRDIWLQKIALWRHLSFNTRYGVKAALRNRGRLVAMVCGIMAMISLLILSLGFRDSFNFATSSYYDAIANYDLVVQTAPTPFTTAPSFIADVTTSAYEPVFTMAATVTHNGVSKDITTFISDEPLKMHNFVSTNGGAIDVKDGVVLPREFAHQLGVKQGDTVAISTVNKSLDGEVKVVDISNQDLKFSAIMTLDAARDKLGFNNEAYNFVYMQVRDDAGQAAKNLSDNSGVISASSKADDQSSYHQLTQTFNMFIIILVAFSVVLGIAALYAISSITLLSRQYEFVVLRVMGYSQGDVLLAYVKELLLQCVFAIPIGLFGGYVLLQQLLAAFKTDSMSFSLHITPFTYASSVAIALAVLGVMVLIARHQLIRQDLVEGLKSRNE